MSTSHTVLLRDSQSLPNRQRIKPTNAEYDRISFEHLKARCIVTPTGCWEIQGLRYQSKGMTHAGYGIFSYRGRGIRAHRAAYMIAKGPIPPGHVVAHRCDNPPCCNPDHLFTCTESENILDAVSKKRDRQTRKATCPRGHEYDYVWTKGNRRKCSKCDRIRHRMAAGWSFEEARDTPVVAPGQKTERRVIGVLKRTHGSDDTVSTDADYDGAPYCSDCGARKREHCKCPPRPRND